jgi:radical SAM superfamily enzyme YgiQ (UPF0313 family)
MHLCLVSPPTVAEFDASAATESAAIRLIAEHAPLGVLTLAACVEERGFACTIVDLNRAYYDYLREAPIAMSFATFGAARVAAVDADVYGFSSLCSSYPLTLRLAEGVCRRRPDSPILFGGPQASVVDGPTLRTFPFVDFVLRGEADETLGQFLDVVAGEGSYATVPGLTYRSGNVVTRNEAAPLVVDLDAVPLPAFHLYPHLAASTYAPLELGRGCPYACRFCSTNDFFRRRFRLKSPAVVLAQMRHLRDTYGITAFDLVHDMFTVARGRVVDFCEALIAADEGFVWGCSARTDRIDPELIELMAAAGCRGIFFGIETGSKRLQREVNKKLDLEAAASAVRISARAGMETAVSLIVGFPTETMADIKQSVDFIMRAARNDNAAPQMHLLAPLAGTPLEIEHRDALVLEESFSDMSHQGWHVDRAEWEMIRDSPDVFPNFYAIPTPHLDRGLIIELREFVLQGLQRVRWLLIALGEETGDLVEVFLAWRRHRRRIRADGIAEEYATPRLWEEFGKFVSNHVQGFDGRSLPASQTIAAVSGLAMERSSSQPPAAVDPGSPDPADGGEQPVPLTASDVIAVPAGTRVIRVDRDYAELIRRLREDVPLGGMAAGPVDLALRTRDDGDVEIVQLSESAGLIMRLCSGGRTVESIAAAFARDASGADDIPPWDACLAGIAIMRSQGLVVAA